MTAADLFKTTGTYTRYQAEIQVVDKMIGGIPKNPDTIKQWLKARLDVGDQELIQLTRETAMEMKAVNDETPSIDTLVDEVARKFEGGQGFKTVDGQLVYEGRCMKAALKEAMNVAYPGTSFPGKPKQVNKEGKEADLVRKGLLRFGAETIFVEENYIPLGVSEPSGTEQRIKHIVTPQGPRSAITVVDYVEKPKLSCTIRVMDDFLPPEAWGRIWSILENIGLGTDRARSDGKFELIGWDKLR
jgi:hypothetical protein